MTALHRWEECSAAEVFADFKFSPTTEDIIFATYGGGSYDGDAFVLFLQDGKLFEVNARHCSCYGLQGQWEPEETTPTALRHRMTAGTLGQHGNDNERFDVELTALLDNLYPRAEVQS